MLFEEWAELRRTVGRFVTRSHKRTAAGYQTEPQDPAAWKMPGNSNQETCLASAKQRGGMHAKLQIHDLRKLQAGAAAELAFQGLCELPG
jgi:hypothetical protein